MAGEAPKGLELDFLVAYPREAEVGKKYLMTVDLRVRGALQAWPYEEEEYPLYLMVDSEPAFDNEPVGQGTVVLHRFGGTYGPAQFVLTARKETQRARVSISLVNSAGVSLRKQSLPDVRVVLPALAAVPPLRSKPIPKAAPPNSIGWLHLSNLMMGEGRPSHWERAFDALLEDLDRLYEKCGPWDFVFCSGDLTLRGSADEFSEVSGFFGGLEAHFRERGMSPRILAVPGNHDMERASDHVFQNYSRWWQAWTARSGTDLKSGLLPGDFSTVFERGGVRLGIVGLNDVLEGAINVEALQAQLDGACDGDFDQWSHGVDACVVLTHEPLRAMDEQWAERKKGEPFLLHLTGHFAGPGILRLALPSTTSLVLSGRTLFPADQDGTRHGYVAGRISFEEAKGSVRVWPRLAWMSKSRGLQIEADQTVAKLDLDEGIEAAVFTRQAASVREAREDWAIVVGINHYPHFTYLAGPESDARAFHDWLIGQANVPVEHVSMLLSSNFPPSESNFDDPPGPAEIEELFDRIASMATENQRQRGNMRVGRRLYLYFSGAGAELAGIEPVFLTSGASPSRLSHIAPRAYAEWFRRSGSFDEVFLFFDCDRRDAGNAPARLPSYPLERGNPGLEGRMFSALAPRRASETLGSDGKIRGAFTSKLLAGLTGDASDDEGRVTARSLADYLSSISQQATSEELPEVVYSGGSSDDFVITHAPPRRYDLELQVEQRLEGRGVRVLNYRHDVVDEFKATASSRVLEVARGHYLVSVEGVGELKGFEVHEATRVELSESKESGLQLRVTPRAAGTQADLPSPPGSLLFNGIDWDTGQYQIPRIEPERAASLAGMFASSLVSGTKRSHLGEPPPGMPPQKLHTLPWGVVFAANRRRDLQDTLRPLIAHREQLTRSTQSGVPILDYRPGEKAWQWLERHGRLPYHLLIVGGPDEIPFDFQQELSQVRSVGRLSFDNAQHYATYASRVVEYERGSGVRIPRRITLWSPRYPGDEVSTRINARLITPLHEGLPDAQCFQGEAATWRRLSEALEGLTGNPSALVFAAAHGVAANHHPLRHQHQGGLLGQEWSPFKPLSPSVVVSQAESSRGIHSRSLIAFFFASFSAGTSLEDGFARALVPQEPRPPPFAAALPRQLLGLPGQGTLAVLGQVDWAWAVAAGEEAMPRPHVPYRDCMRRILSGEPVGHAVREEFGRRYSRASWALLERLSAPGEDRSAREAEMLRELLQLLDARSLVVLGDPAVRLNLEAENL